MKTLVTLTFVAGALIVGGCDRDRRAPDGKPLDPSSAMRAPVTALDQGESARDRELSARIRQGILSDGNLSLQAKNVLVVTRDGVVTLKGPVKSAEERNLVASYAKREAGPGAIDDRLEVYPN